MSILRSGLAAMLVIGGLASASTALAQANGHSTDRYALGPSTPNSDGSEGYGSYSAMPGSTFIDGRRDVAHHNDGFIYPLDTARKQPAPGAYVDATDEAAAPPRSAFAENTPAARPVTVPDAR